MLGKIFGVLTLLSVLFALPNGTLGQLSSAATQGAASAVELSFSMLGGMCFWCGVAAVLERVGVVSLLERVMMPVLRFVYPDAYKEKKEMRDIAANISANFLGLGNAALPKGISAMRSLSDGNKTASDDMITFVVLATTPFQLIPSTLASLRQATGSASPFEVLLPIWICEIATTVFAILLCRLLAGVSKICRR